jgi:polyisoprenoid-binding protein YceI
MTNTISPRTLIRALGAALMVITPLAVAAQDAPLTLTAGRVAINGTSNIHEFTATTTEVRVTKLTLAAGVSPLNAAAPGAVEAFEIVIRAASLSSPKEGLDKNMHKALKTAEHPDIMFRLLRLEPKPAAAGALRAVGVLKIAGVEKEVAFDLKTAVTGATLTVSGDVPLLMTDFGITPPKAMLGMLKTDNRITVKFDTVLAMPTTF